MPTAYAKAATERDGFRALADRLERRMEMIRARLLDARDHINVGAADAAIADINRALELSANQPST